MTDMRDWTVVIGDKIVVWVGGTGEEREGGGGWRAWRAYGGHSPRRRLCPYAGTDTPTNAGGCSTAQHSSPRMAVGVLHIIWTMSCNLDCRVFVFSSILFRSMGTVRLVVVRGQGSDRCRVVCTYPAGA